VEPRRANRRVRGSRRPRLRSSLHDQRLTPSTQPDRAEASWPSQNIHHLNPRASPRA
jgi:hypothetical protein